MPEGDTIWRAAAALRLRLEGRTILEVAPERMAALEGARVTGVETAGKHLTLRFEVGAGRSLALHTHLGMTGSWHLYSRGERWQRAPRQARVVLTAVDVVAVLFSAPVAELHDGRISRTDHLGPDLLAGGFPLSGLPLVLARVRASSAVTAGELLLDQTVCSGIGNIYKCESLWRLRLDPWAQVAGLSEAALAELYLTARRLMGAGLERGPGEGVGAHPRTRGGVAVYGRAGRPCPRCGSRIQVRLQGRERPRATYFCARCQAGG